MMHISSQENDFCGLCSSAKQYPVNCRPEECPAELAALAQLSQQRSTQPDRSMELQPSPDRISGVQMTQTAKSNSKRPKGKHPCQLWEVKGEQACKGFHWYKVTEALARTVNVQVPHATSGRVWYSLATVAHQQHSVDLQDKERKTSNLVW